MQHVSSRGPARSIGKTQAITCQLSGYRPTELAFQQPSSRAQASLNQQHGPHPHQSPKLHQPLHRCCCLPHNLHSPRGRLIATYVTAAAAAQEQPLVDAAAEVPAAEAPFSEHGDVSTTSSSADEAASSSSTESSSSSEDESVGSVLGPQVEIKVLSEPRELAAVAKLRAEAYYEHDRSRFAGSFKKQFAAQEVESLRQRTAPTTSSQRPQLCDCLVAVDAAGAVLGCIDIRLPESYTKMKTIGVPEGDATGCYLLNVVVAEEHRGLGVGKRVMQAAINRAVRHWGAQRLYTHVEADNEVANRLYRSCGFQEHSSEAKYANTSSLGRLVLLMATADQADDAE